MEIKKNIDLDLERRNFEASGICTKSMFENVMWDQWLFKYVPLVGEKKICDNAIKINDRFLGWKAAKSQATPEGFVLVLKVLPSEINDQVWDDYLTPQCVVNEDGVSFISCEDFDLDALYQTLLKAQEQSHELD